MTSGLEDAERAGTGATPPDANGDLFATLADNISQLAWMADASGSIFWYNKRWFDYTGETLEAMQGWGWTKVHHPDHLERVVDKFRNSIERGSPWEDTFPLRAATGEFRWFLSRAMPIRDDRAHIVRWFGTNTDVTDQRLTEERLRESETTFRAMFNTSSLGKAQVAVASRMFTRVNEALCRLTGIGAAQLLAARLIDVVAAEHRPALEAGMAGIAQGATSAVELEVRLLPLDGRELWTQITLNVIVDASGAPYRFSAIFVDVTQRKVAERRNLALMREVNHRSKNLLAIVQAIARQTAHGDDFERRFIARVDALAAAHDVIVENEWKGATLRELIMSQTGPLADPAGPKLSLSGPDVLVSSDASQMLAMAIYELASNAARFGALSTPGGRVAIDWSGVSGGAEKFRIEWRETGGPHARRPDQTGFGSAVTTRLVGAMFDATIDVDYRPEGLVWRLECPLARVVGEKREDEDSP